ncbi:MAG: rod shape-determining protein MreC [Burkholderiaceae bacterium]|nr:MAG: rod shape-determining protein MreC [Burkholderiaceae bacterium]
MHSGPPPFFRQGPSARTRMLFFATVSLLLIMVDSHVRSLEWVRKSVTTVLYPIQQAALLPRDVARSATSYFSSVHVLQRENDRLREQLVQQAADALRQQALEAENAQLKNLFKTKQSTPAPSLLAQVLYDARDPFSRKLILNRGAQDGVLAGQPVIDDRGVIGQVTRVFPLSAELTQLTDHEQAIPVQVLRTGSRSVAYGAEAESMELRFMPTNADIEEGDVLNTSGLDGVFPAGYPVARVTQIERKAGSTFARILCEPIAGIDHHRYVLILQVNPEPEIRPPENKASEPVKPMRKETAK